MTRIILSILRRPTTYLLGLFVIAILGLLFALLILLNRFAPGNIGTQTLVVAGGLVSAILALVGVLIAQVVSAYGAWSTRRHEKETAREDALKKCLDELSKPSSDTLSSEVEAAAASAKARSALLKLDSNRKGVLLKFLHEANLIKKEDTDSEREHPPIQLSGANLAGANLAFADLSGDSFRGAILRGASLRGADLTGTDLRDADLSSADPADLRTTDLRGFFERAYVDNARSVRIGDTDVRDADLKDADLRGTKLGGADLTRADLRGVNLTKVEELTQEQLGQALGDKTTKLPTGLSPPEPWTIVDDTTPASGATEVALDAVVRVAFSERMDPSTLTDSTLKLSDTKTGKQVPAAVSYAEESKTATLTPSEALLGSTKYKAEITTEAKDRAGNKLNQGYSWTLTTVSS